MRRVRGSSIAFAGAVILLAAIYAASERVARSALYPPVDPKGREQVAQRALECLPAFLRRPFDQRLKIARLRGQLAQASAAEPYFKAVAALAPELSPEQALELYDQAVNRYPDHPLAADAMVALTASGARSLTHFRQFADRQPREQQPSLGTKLWGRLHSADPATKADFLNLLLEQGWVDAGLVTAYEDHEATCVKKGNLRDADRAAALQRACLLRRLQAPPPKPAAKSAAKPKGK